MSRLRRRNHGGQQPERQRVSVLSRLRAIGATVKRRTFPVRKGSRTDNRKVVARVKGVEGAPLTHPERYVDPAALDRAYQALTRTSDAEPPARADHRAQRGS